MIILQIYKTSKIIKIFGTRAKMTHPYRLLGLLILNTKHKQCLHVNDKMDEKNRATKR